jgi:hypothetical protein
MKNIYLRFLATALFFSSFVLNSKAQTTCDASGNLVIFTNYDGGTMNINVDANIPNLKIGICSYEAVRVNIAGTYSANVTQVIYAGYNGTNNTNCTPTVSATSINGVSAGIVTINALPPVGYSNPNGYGSMVCGYSCSSTTNQGGCNTSDQIAYYFMQQTGGTLRFQFLQYGCWAGATKTISGGGNCCDMPCTTPSAPTNTTAASQQVICANKTTTLSATSTGTVNWYASPTSTLSLGSGTTFVTPSLSAGTYTYYAQTINTCTTSISRTPVTVTVNPAPPVAVNSGSVCSGKSFTMTPTGAITYTFSNGSAIVIPNITSLPSVVAMFTVTGSNAQGCTNTAISSVTVYASPTVSVSPAAGNACVNSAGITLTGSPSGGIYSGTNVSSNSFTPVSSGTFTPVYSYTNSSTGCSNTASTSIVVSTCTGIDQFTKTGSGLSIYPNPTSGEFTVEFANAEEKHIKVMDITGRLIYSGSGFQDKTFIDINHLADGMYYVQVQSGSVVETIKVVKQ